MSSKPALQKKLPNAQKRNTGLKVKARKVNKRVLTKTKRSMATGASQGDIIGIDLGVCFSFFH